MALETVTQSDFLERRLLPNPPNFFLAHEIGFHEEQFKEMARRQSFHGEHLGLAMGESSETFHDNAPAEAVVSDQEVLVNEVTKLRVTLRNAVVVEYPNKLSPVTLGSVCLIDINKTGAELYYLAGHPNGYNPEHFEADITPLSINGPIGRAIIGQSHPTLIETEISGRPLHITVLEFEQPQWPVVNLALLKA